MFQFYARISAYNKESEAKFECIQLSQISFIAFANCKLELLNTKMSNFHENDVQNSHDSTVSDLKSKEGCESEQPSVEKSSASQKE